MSGGGLRKRVKPFVQVDRRTVRDGRLSFRALGGLTYLLDRPDGWDVRAEQMSTSGDGREGREAVRTLLRELGATGYYRLERRRMRDGTFAMGTAVSEEPVESWAAQHRFFEGKAVPMVEQADGSFLVRYPDGTLGPDDFPPPEPPEQGESTGAQEPVSGEPGPRNPASGEPASGSPGPDDASPLEDAIGKIREEEPPNPRKRGGTPPAGENPPTSTTPRQCTHGRTSCRPCGTTPRQVADRERRDRIEQQRAEVPQWRRDLADRRPASTSSASRQAARTVAAHAGSARRGPTVAAGPDGGNRQ